MFVSANSDYATGRIAGVIAIVDQPSWFGTASGFRTGLVAIDPPSVSDLTFPPIATARGGEEDHLFRLVAPSEDEVRHFISQQQHSTFSSPEVGASAGNVPSRYNVDHNRAPLGNGEITWHRAVDAIRGWQMFNMPWIRLYWPTAPIQVGTDVAVLVRHFGFYSLNACRIVYVTNENGTVARYGFAYGTLAEHAEGGEERFTVEWNRADDKVWYDILAFSRPHKTLAKLGYPLSRMLQRRFAEASKAAMVEAASEK